MKRILFITILILAFGYSNAQKKVGRVKLKTSLDSVSYAFGISIANNLENQKVEQLNPRAIAKAFEDFYKKEGKITNDEANQIIQDFFDEKEADKHKDAVDEGKHFLAENAKKEGVVTTKSGLQYKIIKEGTGNIPKSTDKVKVHYKGTLISGKTFDSSYDRGQPATFGVTQVIKGWTEVLQLMKEGSIYEVYIPYKLAYGSRGAGADIKPFTTLIFTVELISIEK